MSAPLNYKSYCCYQRLQRLRSSSSFGTIFISVALHSICLFQPKRDILWPSVRCRRRRRRGFQMPELHSSTGNNVSEAADECGPNQRTPNAYCCCFLYCLVYSRFSSCRIIWVNHTITYIHTCAHVWEYIRTHTHTLANAS